MSENSVNQNKRINSRKRGAPKTEELLRQRLGPYPLRDAHADESFPLFVLLEDVEHAQRQEGNKNYWTCVLAECASRTTGMPAEFLRRCAHLVLLSEKGEFEIVRFGMNPKTYALVEHFDATGQFPSLRVVLRPPSKSVSFVGSVARHKRHAERVAQGTVNKAPKKTTPRRTKPISLTYRSGSGLGFRRLPIRGMSDE